MPRLIYRVPSYRKHKPSGQAVVTLNGQDHYLGRYGSAASKREYQRLITQWHAGGRELPPEPGTDITVSELACRFWRHVKTYYVKNGRPTSEQHCIRLALRPVRRLFDQTLAVEFGPLALKTVRQVWIDSGLARSSINKHVCRIRLMFKWGTENELIPASVHHALQAVAGLRRGRSAAREPEPVKPVPEHLIDGLEGHVSDEVWAMIQLQRITGMRPGEVIIMRRCDIDITGDLWEYRPPAHKTEHYGRERVVPLGPKAQGVVRGFLKPDFEAYLFSPAEAEKRRSEMRRRERIRSYRARHPKCYAACNSADGIPPSQRNRRKAHRQKPPRDCYDNASYRRAIERGCAKAFPLPKELAPHARKWGEKVAEWHERTPPALRRAIRAWYKSHYWHPHRLRHNRATELRKKFGIEAARVILGHSSAAVTDIYAEMDHTLAAKIAREVG